MTSTKKRIVSLLTLLPILLIGLPGAHAEGLLKQVESTGTIKVGIANEIPYGYKGADGKVQGIAPNVAKHVLHEMGVKHIEWVVLPFGALIPAVKAGRIDMASASQNVLPERCKQVTFSKVNSSYGEGLLVLKGNPHGIHSYKAFKDNPKLKLGVVTGADELNFAQAMGIPQSQVVMINANSDAIPALMAHRIDAYAATGLTVHNLAKRSPAVVGAEPFTQPIYHGKPTRSYGAFSFRKSDKAFIKRFDEKLAAYQKTSAWARDEMHYGLSHEDVEAARKASTEMLCSGH